MNGPSTKTTNSLWRWWWLLPLAAWYAYSVYGILHLTRYRTWQVELTRWLVVLVVVPLLAYLVSLMFVSPMKCPHCGERVGHFAVRKHRWTGDQTCPHCGAWVNPGISRQALLLWGLPTALVVALAAPFVGMIPIAIGVVFVALRSRRLTA